MQAELMARLRALIGKELRRDQPDDYLINALICELNRLAVGGMPEPHLHRGGIFPLRGVVFRLARLPRRRQSKARSPEAPTNPAAPAGDPSE